MHTKTKSVVSSICTDGSAMVDPLAISSLQQQLFGEGVVSRKLLDSVPSPLLILNHKWQVIYANRAVMSLVGGRDPKGATGLSEGEAFHCVHSRRDHHEAGKHDCCRVCGVARVLSRSFSGEEASEDCHLTCRLDGSSSSLDLRVQATPLEFHGEQFSILSLVDISDKHQREILEKVCYHDLLNTLTSIKGVISVLQDGDVAEQAEICAMLDQMTQNSIEEINTLRLLEQAEQSRIKLRPETVEAREFLALIHKTLQSHPAAKGKSLLVAEEPDDLSFISDYQLLSRTAGNLVINALEATEACGTVSIGCYLSESGICFWVKNAQFIPPEIQRQLFERCVSSKGESRGIGTYSIKLLSSMLGGRVEFTSCRDAGTVFSLWLPRNLPAESGA